MSRAGVQAHGRERNTPSGRRAGFALLILLLAGLGGCGQQPPLPALDVTATRADTSQADAPLHGEPPPTPASRPLTPFDGRWPDASRLVQSWEEVFYSNRDREGVEADSVLFFRYQVLLSHLDPGLIDSGAAPLIRRAADLRTQVAGARDAAWARWQVGLIPPPEPTAAHDPHAALTIKPVDNERVRKWIDFFTGPGRERFAGWNWRAGAYRELMQKILIEEGVPPELLAVVYIESGFNLQARSRARAVGPWQFISGTGKRYGLTINRHRDERRDFVHATRAAARYFKDLYELFGDWELALAAYNCGEGRVFRSCSRQGTTDYWQLDLPRQTEDYVPEVHAVIRILSDLPGFGFSDESAEPLQYTEVELPGPVRVDDLARHVGADADYVKALNPSWLRGITPADGAPVRARLPHVDHAISLASLPLVPIQEARNAGGSHRVRKGETLSAIARKYGVSTAELARENGISRKSRVRTGQVLRLPDGADVDPPAPSSRARDRSPGSRTPTRSRSKARPQVHVVRRGETLSQIAARYGVSIQNLLRWNRLSSSHRIRQGQRLKLAG